MLSTLWLASSVLTVYLTPMPVTTVPVPDVATILEEDIPPASVMGLKGLNSTPISPFQNAIDNPSARVNWTDRIDAMYSSAKELADTCLSLDAPIDAFSYSEWACTGVRKFVVSQSHFLFDSPQNRFQAVPDDPPEVQDLFGKVWTPIQVVYGVAAVAVALLVLSFLGWCKVVLLIGIEASGWLPAALGSARHIGDYAAPVARMSLSVAVPTAWAAVQACFQTVLLAIPVIMTEPIPVMYFVLLTYILYRLVRFALRRLWTALWAEVYKSVMAAQWKLVTMAFMLGLVFYFGL